VIRTAYLFPEGVMNLAGYERLQAGKHKDAIALFTLNRRGLSHVGEHAGQPGRRLPCRRPARARAGGVAEMPRVAPRPTVRTIGGKRPSGRVPERNPEAEACMTRIRPWILEGEATVVVTGGGVAV
jgi:hypothetical protein